MSSRSFRHERSDSNKLSCGDAACGRFERDRQAVGIDQRGSRSSTHAASTPCIRRGPERRCCRNLPAGPFFYRSPHADARESRTSLSFGYRRREPWTQRRKPCPRHRSFATLTNISKQGDRYLCRLLVVGATAVIHYTKNEPTSMANWIRRLLEKKPFGIVSVALADELARIAW